jgi:hypothetical protein
LSALAIAYKYIPEKTNLVRYLEEQFKETYLGVGRSSRNSKGDKEEGERRNGEDDRDMVMDVSIKILTEKYKNYLVEKDIDF